MAPAGIGGPASTTPRDPSVRPRGERDPHEEARRLERDGIRLIEGTHDEARHEARQIAAELRTVLVVEPSPYTASSEDPAEAMRLALRDAVVFETRQIARVIAGRLTRMEAPGPRKEGSASTPPSRLEVDLETDEDRRTVQLEDAWAWNLHESGAKEGDLVQIDREHPLVTLHAGTEVLEGRVLDERDHRIQISLGALDRAHAAPETAGSEDEDPDERVLSRAARSPALMLATGERSPTGATARGLTDAWVRRRLAGRHTRVVPGVLLVLDAAGLPERAAAALRAARTATAAPWVLVHESDEEQIQELGHRWRRVLPENRS